MMDYAETLDWLFRQLPMYQREGKTAYKKDLSNTLLLAKHLKHPEKKIKTIHVGGTNGKGSCSHMIASILQESGYKVGLYTSPHLKDYRERIKINGKEISEKFVVEFIAKHKSFFESNRLSFFEMTVGLAFNYFAKSKVDIAVIEVGLGGRLDSTNIITPILSIITNIGFDHVEFLGDTLAKIAYEKAGIIKPNVPVVIGESHEETIPVFKSKAEEVGSSIYFVNQNDDVKYVSDLQGMYQSKNIKTVLKSFEVLCDAGYDISEYHLRNGLMTVVQNTNLMGRWQQLSQKPKIVCDTAHNKEGLTYTMQQIKSESYDKLHIVFGVVNDKDIEVILPLLPTKATYYIARPNIPRGMPANILANYFKANNFEVFAFESVMEAFEHAKINAAPNDFIYVGGSTFVVAEIL